jgi:hypothetical protein
VTEPTPGTGRLFRSLRAEGAAADTAIPALGLDQVIGLRTVTLGSGPVVETVAAVTVTPVLTPEPLAPAPTSDPARPESVDLEYAEVAPRPEAPLAAEAADAPIAAAAAAGGRHAHAASGVRPSGIWLVVLGVTVVMGFADALVVGRTQLGWLTGVSLLAVSIYGALVVRRDDAIIAVIAPPLAFFLATITAGQLTLPPTGDLLVREAFMIITTLGANAVWIFGSTITALVIVLVRRRRSAP